MNRRMCSLRPQPSTSDSLPSRSPTPGSGGRGTGTSSRPARLEASTSVRSMTGASGGSRSMGDRLSPGGRPAAGVGQVGGAAGVAHPDVLQFGPPVGAPDLAVALAGRVVDDRVAVLVEADQHAEMAVGTADGRAGEGSGLPGVTQADPDAGR